jgi:uncharacterized protein YgiM (DUF1202 family)
MMPLNSKVLGATLLAVAAAMMAAPAFGQQNPPPAGQQAPPDMNGPPPNGLPPGSPPPGGPPQGGPPPQAGPAGPARSAMATANVNLRSGPGTDAEIIATIPGGSMVRVTGCSGEWCAVTWNGRPGYAVARNLDIGGTRQARAYRPQPGYAEGPPVYEAGPPVVYGAPAYYYPPAVVYGPGYYGPGYYGWRRRW